MKRVLSMVLSMAMMLSMVCVSHAADGGVLSATVDGPAEKGGTVEVDINFDSNPGFYAAAVKVGFDKELTFVEAAYVEEFEDASLYVQDSVSEDKGYVMLMLENGTPENTASTGTAVVITLQVPADATGDDAYEVSFESVEVVGLDANFREVDIPFESTGCTITVDAPTTNPVRATAGENGSISPAGDTQVDRGEDITYTITADEGYHVDSIKVDTVAVDFEKSSVVEYTLTNVTDPKTIEVTFAPHEPVGDNGNCDDVVTCAGCVDTLKPATEHAWDEGTVTLAATCTEDGTMHYVCTVETCSAEKDEVIEATGHSHESVVTAPTCTEAGYTTYTCPACGDTYTADEVAATGHNYEAVVTAPTCTEQGYTTHTCSACGDSYVDSYVDATGHTWDEGTVTKAATCTEEGVMTHECTECDTTEDRAIAMLPHDCVETVLKDATCTEDGEKAMACKNCDYAEERAVIPATGHAWDEGTVTKEATCTEVGVMTHTCLNACGTTDEREIAATGHNYEAVVTAPTCNSMGYTTYTCSACGDSYVADWTDALSHVWDLGTVTKEATCTEAGIMTYTCTNGCGATDEREIPATGHSLTETVTKEPTCTEVGEKVTSCANCDYAEEPVEIPAKGHSHTAVVTEPTCTEGGYTTYTCTCGDTYVADQVPAKGHNYESGTCTNCGEKKPTGGGSSGGGGGGGGGGSATVIEYTLTFDTNGGTAVAAVTKNSGTTVKLGNYTTTKPGYTFAGWYTDEALTEPVTSVKLTDDMTIYAKWTINDKTDASNLPFTDVNNHWAKTAIAYAYNTGIMQGVSAIEFDPNGALTRAMVVTILYSMEGRPAVTAENPFSDVAESAYYADAVAWAASHDVVAGIGEGQFAPNALITREQLATIMCRYAAYKGQDVSIRADLTSFADEETISGWALENMKWAVARGIISGTDTGALDPLGTTTRAQCAQIMYSFLEK